MVIFPFRIPFPFSVFRSAFRFRVLVTPIRTGVRSTLLLVKVSVKINILGSKQATPVHELGHLDIIFCSPSLWPFEVMPWVCHVRDMRPSSSSYINLFKNLSSETTEWICLKLCSNYDFHSSQHHHTEQTKQLTLSGKSVKIHGRCWSNQLFALCSGTT